MLTGIVEIMSTGDELEIMDYENLTIDSDAVVSVDGKVTSAKSVVNSTRKIRYQSFEILSSGNDMETDTSIVLNQTIAFDASSANSTNTYSVNMTGVAPWTQGRNLTVSNVESFGVRNPSAGNYHTGSLFMATDNGESLVLQADTGNYGTWFATINDAGFATNRYEMTYLTNYRTVIGDWDNVYKLPCVFVDNYCR